MVLVKFDLPIFFPRKKISNGHYLLQNDGAPKMNEFLRGEEVTVSIFRLNLRKNIPATFIASFLPTKSEVKLFDFDQKIAPRSRTIIFLRGDDCPHFLTRRKKGFPLPIAHRLSLTE